MYSIINLAGLSVGTAVVILLTLYVYDEWTFDRFHQKSDRIYRAWVKEHVSDQVFFNTVTPYILGEELQGNFPEIRHIVRYSTLNSQVKKGNFSEQEIVHIVEPEFFKVFDFNLLRGKAEDVLADVHNAVITEDIGKKYFGDPAVIGQTLTMQVAGQWTDFVVSGIIEKAPGNSSLQYDILIPFEIQKTAMSEGSRTSWTNVNVETFVLLDDNNNVKDLEAKIAPFIDSKVADIYKPGEYQMGLQPLTDIHLNKDFPEGFLTVSDARYPYILSGIAALILMLACINFTSLAVGRSISRAKEVGVRKATGASKQQIMMQFWSEAIMTSTAGALLGVLIAKASLGAFNTIADKQLELHWTPMHVMAIGSLALLTGLIAGAYPSLVLSGFSPVKTLRGAITKMGSDKHVLLRSLVGFQFLLSILLIICTIVMTQQLRFIQNKNLGFEQDQVVILPYARSGVRLSELYAEGQTTLGRLRHTLTGKTEFKDFALTTHAFGTPGWMNLGYTEQGTEKFRKFFVCGVDDRLVPMMQLQITEGRNFSSDAVADKQSVLVNEAYAREFNVKYGEPLQQPFQEYSVIGIVKDFNFESLHTTVQPLVMAVEPINLIRTASDLNYGDNPNPKLLIKVAGENLTATLSVLRQAWLEVAPEQPFNYVFLNENIDKQYRSEARLSKVISIASVLAVLIACLGLFGIVTLTVAQRTKEIGIRKVLGASTAQLASLLSNDFLKLVLLAVIPASPMAWYFMNGWLEDFAYRIEIEWWVFVLAGVAAVIVALLTVSFQSMKAALSNPVKSLRSE
ncbi:MAG TPA: ABC transporter permease [Saprospiraceae bacterium]|nr:ABC transporter permease [Saprospiraceae bacterium]